MMQRVLHLSLLASTLATLSLAQSGGELRFCLRADPKTFDPLAVEDDNSEAIRYITGGVLLRVNRKTQELTPELAQSWNVDQQGRRITFHLRRGISFSDGTPFTADDVAYTVTRLMDPALHSATADPFRSSNLPPKIAVTSPDTVAITFAAPVSGLDRLFDQVAMLSRNSPKKLQAVLGPFYVAEYKPGVEVTLARNPHYWKVDSAGKSLPYLDRIHLQIQQNRDMELVRFGRGEIDLINSLDPAVFDQLSRQSPGSVSDAGASLESEMIWFNQAPSAPLPEYKKAWFASQDFRRAVSEAIHRDDISKLVFHGHAEPAAGPVSPANRFWVNSSLVPHKYDLASAQRRLQHAGFVRFNSTLLDRDGHEVEFSIVTNAGNKTRERIAAMLQQDLKSLGIRLNVVTLDFPSLIERITKTSQYEACLLGLSNVDLDPNAQMNVWLSSASDHQWNPGQKTPATPWEAEIDRLMRAQAAEQRPEARKALFDQVQQIVWEQEPFIYLVNKHSLMAFSPQLRNLAPATVRPEAYWNIEQIQKSTLVAESR
ncbi:MAG TPA: ABC transporter substrate-binding protein [Bryobacteraceae bacterium]|nr:ABC transporter substrate-binding protein [Bryobacteraceae bacterium]